MYRYRVEFLENTNDPGQVINFVERVALVTLNEEQNIDPVKFDKSIKSQITKLIKKPESQIKIMSYYAL